MANFTFTTPGSNDVLTIDSPAAGQNRVSGTSGGGGFEAITFFDVTNFIVNAGTNDAAAPDDTLTIDASGLVATGLQNFTYVGGAGNDSLTVLSTNYSLPAGGAFTFDGGGGTSDKFIGNANIGYTLANTGVTSSTGGTIVFAAVEESDLTGGAAANTFNINSTAILANLIGDAGNDNFVFAAGASVSGGTIDGGGDTDLLDYTAYTSALGVNLGLSSTGLSATFGADRRSRPRPALPPARQRSPTTTPSPRRSTQGDRERHPPVDDVEGFHIHRGPVGINGPIIVDFGTAGLVADGSGFTFNATGVALGICMRRRSWAASPT